MATAFEKNQRKAFAANLELRAWRITRYELEPTRQEIWGFLSIACEVLNRAVVRDDNTMLKLMAEAWNIGQELCPSDATVERVAARELSPA